MSTINLNTANVNEIESFMEDNELYTCADIGREVSLTRERVRQIFKNREDLNFSKIKKSIIQRKFKDNTSETFKWKLITFVQTKYPYYVSECGKVARDIVYKKHGVKITKRKLLTASSNKSGHLRVNLTLANNNEDGSKSTHKTFYLHQVVAKEFLEKPNPNYRLKGVTPLDGDLSNCHSKNLAWSYFNG